MERLDFKTASPQGFEETKTTVLVSWVTKLSETVEDEILDFEDFSTEFESFSSSSSQSSTKTLSAHEVEALVTFTLTLSV